uniref:hypothetical protein n=1 Tax=Ruegeria sp. PR1b TaxID=185588 RepID=UPI00146CCA37|nr:hypothetical protein [Ruegeria sp. PR1b]
MVSDKLGAIHSDKLGAIQGGCCCRSQIEPLQKRLVKVIVIGCPDSVSKMILLVAFAGRFGKIRLSLFSAQR